LCAFSKSSLSADQTADDLSQNIPEEIQKFFRVYKNLEEKQVLIQEFESLDLAIELINNSICDYKKKFIAE